MPSDRSRRTDGLRDGYTGVVAQQGRVTVDRDFNAEHGFVAGRIEAEAYDVIGPCGTPDNGFAISIAQTSPPEPPLWSPPPPLSPPTPHVFDFLISPGTMYVGGQRAVFEQRPAGHPVTYSYYDQPDWIPPSIIGFTDEILRDRGRELVFLSLAEQEVGAVEDSDLLDVALGGPDTTQRLRLLRRVLREPVAAPDCLTAWDEVVARWRAQDGLVVDPRTMQLRPEVRLRVGFSNAEGTPDPCDPIAQNGYLRAENQTIRVQISDAGNAGSSGSQAKLLWGYDNASFLYRATPLASNPAMLAIAPPPPDTSHIPQKGQAVEILRTGAVLGAEPDATDPAGQRSIIRCVAEPSGIVRRLTQPYKPVSPGDPVSYIVLDEPLPDDYLADPAPLFLRVWQSEIEFDPAGDTVPLTDDVTGASTGVEVTISPNGEVLPCGFYWLLTLRRCTPQTVYPERLLTAPQEPDGPRLWACPLAVIDWTNRENPTVTDCRNQFDNLVVLSRRRAGCCTIAVSPADLVNGIGLQAAINHAARLQPGATICLAPGSYALPTPLRLTSAHAGLTIKSCGGAVVLTSVQGNEAKFAEGIVVLVSASGVTLRGLTIQPVAAPLPSVVGQRPMLETAAEVALLRRILPGIGSLIGVHAADSADLTLVDCVIEFTRAAGNTPLDIFGVGLFIQGDCSGLRLHDCSFTSQIFPTFNSLTSTITPPANVPPTNPPSPNLPPTNAPPTSAPPVSGGGANSALATPPSGFSTAPRMLDLARSSLHAIATSTTAIDVAVTSPPIASVVTVGCLAMNQLGPDPTDASINCQLGTASLRNNTFSNLTLAMYGVIDTDILRLEDNEAAQCIGGFWLKLTGSAVPTDATSLQLFSQVSMFTFGFAERLILDVIGSTYPLPQDATVPIGRVVDKGPVSLFVIGNRVEPIPVDRHGSAALLILGNLPVPVSPPADTSVSLVISNNQLHSQSDPRTAAALLLVPQQARCSIIGNLILHDPQTTGTFGPCPSLWLVQERMSTKGPKLLSIVGNVMQGTTDLRQLSNTDTSGRDWTTYNAIEANQ
jgi:hypothetical protein